MIQVSKVSRRVAAHTNKDGDSLPPFPREGAKNQTQSEGGAELKGGGKYVYMARIYISSTFQDLQEERLAAAQAIRRLRHEALAMEDYVAEEQVPLDKCLADIRGCQAFIGIYAFRYGYVPEGYDKSITHLEYEEAGQRSLACCSCSMEMLHAPSEDGQRFRKDR